MAGMFDSGLQNALNPLATLGVQPTAAQGPVNDVTSRLSAISDVAHDARRSGTTVDQHAQEVNRAKYSLAAKAKMWEDEWLDPGKFDMNAFDKDARGNMYIKPEYKPAKKTSGIIPEASAAEAVPWATGDNTNLPAPIKPADGFGFLQEDDIKGLIDAGYTDQQIKDYDKKRAEIYQQRVTEGKANTQGLEELANQDSGGIIGQIARGENIADLDRNTNPLLIPGIAAANILPNAARIVKGGLSATEHPIDTAKKVGTGFYETFQPETAAKIGQWLYEGTKTAVKATYDPNAAADVGESLIRPVAENPVSTAAMLLAPELGEAWVWVAGRVGELTKSASQKLLLSKKALTSAERDAQTVEKLRQAVRPSVSWVDTSGKVAMQEDKLLSAVKTIASEWEKPKDAKELLDAIGRTKQKLWEQVKSDNAAVTKNTTWADIAKKIKEYVSDPANSTTFRSNPDLEASLMDFAKKVAKNKRFESMTQDDLQELLTATNAKIPSSSFLKQLDANPAETAKNTVLASIYRDIADSNLEEAIGSSNAALRQQYGNIRQLEKDVARRYGVFARQSPQGLVDMFSMDAWPTIAEGLLTQNPWKVALGVGKKILGMKIKEKNNPNNIIREIFELQSPSVSNPSTLTEPITRGIRGIAPATLAGATESNNQ